MPLCPALSIEGEIIDMAPIGIDHGSAVMQLSHLFHEAVGDRGVVSTPVAALPGVEVDLSRILVG